MTGREQLLQQQLLQERQQFEAWRASQAQADPQPQPPIFLRGQFRLKAMLIFLRGQPVLQVLQGLDLETRSLVRLRLSVKGLHQHLANPPLPRGTTLGGLAQPLGHLRPVPNGLSIRYHLLRTLKPLRLTSLRCCQTCFKPPSSIPALEAKGTLRLRRLWLLSPL